MLDEGFYSLCHLLNVSAAELEKPFSIWRFSVLHVRGVTDLSTVDVYNYFERSPSAIEWLSNISCNVTFHNASMAVNMFLHLAHGLVVSQFEKSEMLDITNLGLEVYTPDSLAIPIPPNHRYILGKSHPKSKAIIIRFAMVDDVKPSQDNPRTTGTDVMQQTNEYDHHLPRRSILNVSNCMVNNILANRDKAKDIRMRLHADDEDEVNCPPVEYRPSITDRLGWREKDKSFAKHHRREKSHRNGRFRY